MSKCAKYNVVLFLVPLLISGCYYGDLSMQINQQEKVNDNSIISCLLNDSPNATHNGFHYTERKPTYNVAGCKEYWICSDCGHIFYKEPLGTFLEKGVSHMKVTPDDYRYLSPVNPSNVKDGFDLEAGKTIYKPKVWHYNEDDYTARWGNGRYAMVMSFNCNEDWSVKFNINTRSNWNKGDAEGKNYRSWFIDICSPEWSSGGWSIRPDWYGWGSWNPGGNPGAPNPNGVFSAIDFDAYGDWPTQFTNYYGNLDVEMDISYSSSTHRFTVEALLNEKVTGNNYYGRLHYKSENTNYSGEAYIKLGASFCSLDIQNIQVMEGKANYFELENSIMPTDECAPDRSTSVLINEDSNNYIAMADPYILHAQDGYYYLYGSNSNYGYVALRSNNVNGPWKRVGHVFADKKHEGTESVGFINSNSFALKDCWAPEVVYNPNTNKYVMVYSGNINDVAFDSSEACQKIGIATSDYPSGPFVDVSGEPLLYKNEDIATIDGSIFIDDDGKAYLYYSLDCSKNRIPYDDGHGGLVYIGESHIYMVRLDSTYTQVVGEPVLISRPTESWERASVETRGAAWNEGPEVYKFGDTYYLNYSVNYFADDNYGIGLSTSKSPYGPFVKNNIGLIAKEVPGVINGPGHGMMFKDDANQLWYVYHKLLASGTNGYARCPVMSPAYFDNQTIKIMYSLGEQE